MVRGNTGRDREKWIDSTDGVVGGRGEGGRVKEI